MEKARVAQPSQQKNGSCLPRTWGPEPPNKTQALPGLQYVL